MRVQRLPALNRLDATPQNCTLDLGRHFREDRLSLKAIGSNLSHALANAYQFCEQGRSCLSMSTYHVDNCLSLLFNCIGIQFMNVLARDCDTDKREHVPFESLHILWDRVIGNKQNEAIHRQAGCVKSYFLCAVREDRIGQFFIHSLWIASGKFGPVAEHCGNTFSGGMKGKNSSRRYISPDVLSISTLKVQTTFVALEGVKILLNPLYYGS